jgi:hypothetical protein
MTEIPDEIKRKTMSAIKGNGGKNMYNENSAETNAATSFRINLGVVFCKN